MTLSNNLLVRLLKEICTREPLNLATHKSALIQTVLLRYFASPVCLVPSALSYHPGYMSLSNYEAVLGP